MKAFKIKDISELLQKEYDAVRMAVKRKSFNEQEKRTIIEHFLLDFDMGIGKRLYKAMSYKGLDNEKALSVATDISSDELLKYISNKETPSVDVLNKIADTLSINVDWLKDGIGPMTDYNEVEEINQDDPNNPTNKYLNDDTVANYIIDNEQSLRSNKIFNMWLRGIIADAKSEAIIEFLTKKSEV